MSELKGLELRQQDTPYPLATVEKLAKEHNRPLTTIRKLIERYELKAAMIVPSHSGHARYFYNRAEFKAIFDKPKKGGRPRH